MSRPLLDRLRDFGGEGFPVAIEAAAELERLSGNLQILHGDLILAKALLRSVRGSLINSSHYEEKLMAEIDAYLREQPW